MWVIGWVSPIQEITRASQEYDKISAISPEARTSEQQSQLHKLDQQISEQREAFKQALEALKKQFQGLSRAREKELNTLLTQNNNSGLIRDLDKMIHDLNERKDQGGVALLTVIVMEDKTHLLLDLRRVSLHWEVSVSAKEIGQEVANLSLALKDPKEDPRPAAEALYHTLFLPELVESLRENHIKTLMVSLDGPLRYLPVAALYDGQQYLVERYAIAVFNPLVLGNIKDVPKSDWTAAGFGVSKAHAPFGKLPHVPEELRAIIQENPNEPGILPGKRILDENFTEERLRENRERPVVHIASHFEMRPDVSSSFLLLGDGRHLTLDQIAKNNVDFGSIDLLTLSACQTEMGGPNAQGGEVDGLGTVTLKAGAKAVIATLWSVDDASTALFMSDFYRLRQDRRLTKADALRQAQLDLLKGAISSPDAKSNRKATRSGVIGPGPGYPYTHPYYWAPFILMGNWL